MDACSTTREWSVDKLGGDLGPVPPAGRGQGRSRQNPGHRKLCGPRDPASSARAENLS